jgi:hypothetical protein
VVRPDYRAVDHLKTVRNALGVVKSLEQKLPKTGQGPAPELAVHRRPLAKMIRQIPPLRARACNPENSIQNKAMIPWRPSTSWTALHHEWFEEAPFLVAHQITDQDALLQKGILNQTSRDLGILFVNKT